MHGEIASAVSIDLGIRGPCHTLSNGCASGLDALGLAFLALRSGWTRRALVLSVDLPLALPLLSAFRSTGVLSTNGINDPYSPETTGFFPGEAGAAFLLETDRPGSRAELLGYWANSDAAEPIGAPPDGAAVAALLRAARAELPGPIRALLPHASGTRASGRSEAAALHAAFPEPTPPTLHLLKPFTGHTLGASGALDTALLVASLAENRLPPNLPGLTPPAPRFRLPSEPEPVTPGDVVLKLSSGMGGRNALLALTRRP